MLREAHCVLGHQASQGGDRGDGEKEGAEAREAGVALMQDTRDERTRPGEGKAISTVTPGSPLHPSPDCIEVQHPDPASGKALQSLTCLQPGEPLGLTLLPTTPFPLAVSDQQSALSHPTLLPPVLFFTGVPFP